MSAQLTIPTAVQRIGVLIPTYRSPILVGTSGGVCTPAITVPELLRQGQEDRTEHYMSTADPVSARTLPDHAPRYWVTSYGVLIAWVTLDGATHYVSDDAVYHAINGGRSSRTSEEWRSIMTRIRTIRRHRDMVRNAWPTRFPAATV